MKKRTKIVATIGPASDSFEQIRALMHAGVNIFRLNFSHGTHEYHLEVLNKIRQAQKETGLFVGVLQDISGPKIRVGKLQETFELQVNDTLEFFKEEIVGVRVSGSEYKTSINQPKILSQLQLGEYIYLYDGMIRSEVIAVGEKSVKVKVLNGGLLSSKKGLNFPNTRLGIEIITPKDREDMRWGVEHGVDFMAISFVQDAEDMKKARAIVESYGGNQQLIAKIEKFDAVENIDAILEASNGIMVARGDLGIEVPYYSVPSLQKKLIAKANTASKPVITATQMLISMTTQERATRAEISDIANAVLDGTDAVMLSEESAVGSNPILAVQTMVHAIRGAESIYPYNKYDAFELTDAADSINAAAVKLSHDVGASGLICLTSSGASVRKISRYRPKKEIYAVVHSERVAHALTLCWGVVPAFMVAKESLGQVMAEVLREGLERGVFHLDRSYVLTAGDPVGIEGTTNMIRILKEREMRFFESLKEE